MLAQLVLSSEQFSHSRSWQRLWTRWYKCSLYAYWASQHYNKNFYCVLIYFFSVSGGSNPSTYALHENSNPSYWCFSHSGKLNLTLYIHFDPYSISTSVVSCLLYGLYKSNIYKNLPYITCLVFPELYSNVKA